MPRNVIPAWEKIPQRCSTFEYDGCNGSIIKLDKDIFVILDVGIKVRWDQTCKFTKAEKTVKKRKNEAEERKSEIKVAKNTIAKSWFLVID